jgi:hypothetical protein
MRDDRVGLRGFEREGRTMMNRNKKSERDPKDRPYVDNYPPLRDWLHERDGSCKWQLPVGDAKEPVAYVESWLLTNPRRGKGPDVAEVLVVVYANQGGWNLYTACRDGKIETTIKDAEERLFGVDAK